MRRIIGTSCLLLTLASGACGDTSADGALGAGRDEPGTAGTGAHSGGDFGQGSGGGTSGAAGTGGVDVPSLPPEMEQSVDLQLPQASENFVYATNPSAGTVSVIYAKTLAIRTLETGDQPTYLRTLAGTDNAIVLNIGSNTATVIRSSVKANVTSTTTKDLPVVSGANAIGVAPDGKHAVVYYNSTYASAGNSSGSFQDVSVLALSTDGTKDASVSMTVGFRPRDVFFSSDGARAYVVSEDGVSELDFAKIAKSGMDIARLVSFGGDIDQKTLDVAVTPDGLYALARAEGKSVLRLVELATGTVKTLDVAKAYDAPNAPPPAAADDDAGVPPVPPPVEITDLDMLPNGKAAMAVLRNQSALVTLPIPGAFNDPKLAKTRFAKDEIVGSVTVSPDAMTALLYTTAANIERITIVNLTDDSAPRTVALRKAVQAVVFTPKSNTALITHTKVAGDPLEAGISPDDFVDRSFGYSLLRLPGGNVKLEVTQTAVGPVAMVPDESNLFILFRDDMRGVKEVHRVSLASFQTDPIIQLESPPISIGTAPASQRVFVNQDHPDGRMTFIDWLDPDKKKTVTGFELNSRIRD
jgi:hypothetical protein